ncbi:MAG: hypothetical protein E7324_02575 [Clostridiales bacterium]|nr:hypothetical protein [Clostridiales bacterium]
MKKTLSLLLAVMMMLSVVSIPAIAEEPAFQWGNLILPLDSAEKAIEVFQGTSETLTVTAVEGKVNAFAAEIGSEARLYWGPTVVADLGKLEGADEANFFGFHIDTCQGAANFSKWPAAFLLQDVHINVDGTIYSVGGGETYYMLPDGSTEWIDDVTDGPSTGIDGNFSGLLVYSLKSFVKGGGATLSGEKLAKAENVKFDFHFNGLGGELGSMKLEGFFLNNQKNFPEEIVIPTPVVPVAGMLRDFETEDDVKAAFAYQNNNFTVTYVNEHTGTGKGAVMLSSETDLHWGNQMYINLGNKLGATDAAFATFIGFHIQAAKGAANGTRWADSFLMQDVQITSGGAWYTLTAGNTYFYKADGEAEWVEETTDGSSLGLPGEFSGYVFIPVASFTAGGEPLNPYEIFSKEWETMFAFHVNAAGGEYGSIYLDTLCYSSAPTLGNVLRTFETEEDVKAAFAHQNNAFTVTFVEDEVGNGAAMLSSETDLHWGNQMYINLGSKLGDTPAAQARYFGFHIQAAKGAANGTRWADAFLMQDVQITSGGAWYTLTKDMPYYYLADGTTQWVTETVDGTSLGLPSEFCGYVYIPVTSFLAGGEPLVPADIFSKQWETMFAFHVNAAGGEYGSFVLDNLGYQLGYEMPVVEEVEEVVYEDIDAVSYKVDKEAIKAINGENALPASQDVILLADYEDQVVETYYMTNASDRTGKEFSRLHVGSGEYAMKMTSMKEITWNGAVNYLLLGNKMGTPEHPASQAKWIGYHISTPNVPTFMIQDVQLAADGAWYTLKGGSTAYIMEDGADKWTDVKSTGSTIYLPGNWTGFVAFNISDFLSDGKSLIPADVFSKQWGTYFQTHYNLAGGPHGSYFVDTYFMLADDLNPAAPTLTVDGEYLAGLTAAPANDVLKSLADSEKVLKIAGERIYARAMDVAAFKALLAADGCEIAVTKEGAAAADDEELAQGMVVTVSKDGAAIAAYYVANITRQLDPAIVFALTAKKDAAEEAGVVVDENGISCMNMKAGELIANVFSVPYGAVAHAFKDGVQVSDETPVETGMTLRCYDEREPNLYFELVFAEVGVLDLTNGYALQTAEGASAVIEGGAITVPAGTTAEELYGMLIYAGADDFGLLLDGDEFPVDDDMVIESGWILLVVDDMYEELARWIIQ